MNNPTFSDIQQFIAPELQQLNQLIAATLTSPNEMMNIIIGNYLKTKGKQIRPILVILGARLFGEVNERVITSAASVELLHNASLIHDDVVDETKLRRNNPTVNSRWDNRIAVLIGDFFVSSSLQLALQTADLRAIDAVARLGRQLSIGELDQIYLARYHKNDIDSYFNTIERKTASLFMACVEMGGFAMGATGQQIAPVKEFARLLGLCFQIRDDIFDYFEQTNIGKPTGNDLREGKITLPLLHVILTDNSERGEAMNRLSRKEELTADEIATLIDYAIEMGGIDYARATMQQLRDKAIPLLNCYPERRVAQYLTELFDYTINRQF